MSPGGFRLTGHVVWCRSSDERGADFRQLPASLYSCDALYRADNRTCRGREEVRDA
ncbi:conserved hypothetical protein [Mycobacterium tuberculosis T17]|uniref:Uncharacterized protein n=1 Tax=Mycobacterium tuberculosis (strain CDC 1551 / Oshkosh) TaxID=83331 RepID=Q8VK04_MYCTO|nr:hypothetical protein MT1585.1 [Mycobacterium tuberculosis CDC1551]EFD46971.1 conserved hypothetical protein [Mycobacterium tuberculosis T17]